jgi:hypothetical protein
MADAPHQTAYAIFGDGTRVALEIAATDDARERGLMFRDRLDDGGGMLFTLDGPGRPAVWMKNVAIPLDIVWLDADRRVVWIVARAEPCPAEPCPIYEPGADACSVLELAAGFVDRHGVAIGDAVALTLPPRPAASSRKSRRGRC